MDATIERTRRHLAEAEADVARLRAELAEAEKDVANLNRALERHIEQQRQEELVRLKRESEETETQRIMRQLRELDGGRRFEGPRRMTMSRDEFRQRRAALNDQFRAAQTNRMGQYDATRMSTQDLGYRHTYLKIFVDEIEGALDHDEDVTMGEMTELQKAKQELDTVSEEYFKRTAWNLQPAVRETPASPKRTTGFRTSKKGLGGGGLKKRHVSPEVVQDDEQRQRRIKALQDDLEYARELFENSITEKGRSIYRERIAEMTKKLEELQRGGPVNSCIECHDPHQNIGRSFCGSECQRTFLLAKMKI